MDGSKIQKRRLIKNQKIMIEADQEIDVIVKSMDNNRIILQVLSEDQLERNFRRDLKDYLTK